MESVRHEVLRLNLGPSMSLGDFLVGVAANNWAFIENNIEIEKPVGSAAISYARWTDWMTFWFDMVADADWAAGFKFAHEGPVYNEDTKWLITDPFTRPPG
ncbi:MAG: hypothetical protein ACTSUE_17215 [Promethearchaeota archaeon]